jgi:hypothetical protein
VFLAGVGARYAEDLVIVSFLVLIRNIPIARDWITQPGKVGSWTRTSASSGSPSSPRLSSTKP